MGIYTRTGDEGETSLFGGGRVSKSNARVAAYGDVDELNAALGLVSSTEPRDFEAELLEDIQRTLFSIGAKLASPHVDGSDGALAKAVLTRASITALESAIDRAVAELPPIKAFLLPGGTPKAVALHLARTVCRRAERSVVALKQGESVPDLVVPYLNRLGDLLFTLARLVNLRAGITERTW